MLHLKPILAALLRNRIAAGVIALQIALTVAIIVNCLYLVIDRVGDMARPSGLDEANLFTLAVTRMDPNGDLKAEIEGDLQALRALPGVQGAISINALPLDRGGWSFTFASTLERAQSGRDEDSLGAAVYMTDATGLAATGMQLSRGRYFLPEEISDMLDGGRPATPVALITDAMARELYGKADPLGQPLYFAGDPDRAPATVIGTLARLQSPWTGWEGTERSAVLPWQYLSDTRRYLIRSQPGQRDAVMGQVEALLAGLDANRIIHRLRSYDEIRQRGYREQRAMAWILIATMIGLSLVTALGIVGMASFWVTQRIKQIGTRRALGARRFDVRRHFQVENGLLSLGGILLGTLLAWLLNVWLVSTLALPKLPLHYLPLAAVAVFLLGQLSVLGPARRASRVSPAVATRTV